MSAPEVEIVHREEFAAAHRLHNPALSDAENVRIYGLCNNEHGHTGTTTSSTWSSVVKSIHARAWS